MSRGTRVPTRSRLPFAYRTVTFSGEPFRTLRLDNRFLTPYERAPQPPGSEDPRFGLFRVRSPLLTESLISFLFLEVLRWFTSLGSPLPTYEFSWRSLDMTPAGLPHSEIPGSKRACRSPRLIAACCVLHRLSVPRHPPSTLSNLTIKCLDLMRSAVPLVLTYFVLCISIYLPIFNCQRNGGRRCPED